MIINKKANGFPAGPTIQSRYATSIDPNLDPPGEPMKEILLLEGQCRRFRVQPIQRWVKLRSVEGVLR
jgi:hypothetical protein